VTIISLDRPDVRNAVDLQHAGLLGAAFSAFDADDHASVAVAGGFELVIWADLRVVDPDATLESSVAAGACR
jgi:enoyl-CoA hydratase